jgi:transcriptional regulator with XRE-family HTH domain
MSSDSVDTNEPATTGSVQLDNIVEQVRRRLRDLVRLSSLSQRQIEDGLGWSRGYLSQVLQGHITLSVGHLLGILGALDRRPEDFFVEFADITSSQSEQHAAIEEIRQRLAVYDQAFAQLRAKGLIDSE